MKKRALLFLGGALAGGALGFWLSSRRMAEARSDLFSPRPLRRLAALGWLAGEDGADAVRVLRDYLAWERQPLLRGRAASILRRKEAGIA